MTSKLCLCVSVVKAGSVDQLEVDPLGRDGVRLAGEGVRDDDLEDVLAGFERGAELEAAGGLDAFEPRLLRGVERLRLARVDLPPLAEESRLDRQSRPPGRL